MPIHLTPPTRRRFLQLGGAGVVAWSLPLQAKEVDEELVVLLNDTHIGEKQAADSPVPSHLRQAVGAIVAAEPHPACVLINGDLALKDGQPGDYRYFERLIRPLSEAGLEVHLTLGNHDHRDVFYEVLAKERPTAPPVPSRHLGVVETRHANFFLLDSLQQTMMSQGSLGAGQLAWFARMLDARPHKPAIVVAHHNPVFGAAAQTGTGLRETNDLWKLFVDRPQVKAYIHGHIHHRNFSQREGVHIVNTPATSYVGDPGKSTTGWTTARLTSQGMTLTTHTNDPNHGWNGAVERLAWRG